MQISLVAIAALIVLVGAFSQNDALVLGDQTIEVTGTPEPTASPTPSPSPEPTAEPTPTAAVQSTGLNSYIYPGATIISSDSSSIQMNSVDDTGVITEWYKEKMRANGFMAKSFVQTSVNDKVTNKLKAADGQIEVSVDITKSSSSDTVLIDVLITN